MVPWTTFEPGQTENLIGVLLGRHLPRTVHLRPSTGDGGIDVFAPLPDGRVDVYQIKYFTGSLTESRKSQIRESTRTLAGNTRVDVRDLYLTVPLRPSQQEHDWFVAYAKKQKLSGRWFDLSHIEGLAASHSDVAAYYVGGAADVAAAMARLTEILGLRPSSTGASLEPNQMIEPLSEVHRALNRDDPFFHYDFQVDARRPPVDSFADRPGLVASCTVGKDGVHVTHHISVKFDAATDYHPVPIQFRVDTAAMSEDLRLAWQKTLDYGTPVSLPGGAVTEAEFGLPGGLGGKATNASIRISPNTGTAETYVLRVLLYDEDDTVSEAAFIMQPVTVGITRSGIRAHGTERGGVCDLEVLTTGDETGDKVNISVSLRDMSGLQPGTLRQGIKWLANMRSPHTMAMAPEFGPAAPSRIAIPAGESLITQDLVDLVEALADLQERLDGQVRFPDVSTLTGRDCHAIVRAGRLVRGETVKESWAGRVATARMTERPEVPDGPVEFAISGSQEVRIGDRTVLVEPLTIVLVAASLTVQEVGDGTDDEWELTATPALGNTTMITRRATIEDVPAGSSADL